jgi:hypothetical protein
VHGTQKKKAITTCRGVERKRADMDITDQRELKLVHGIEITKDFCR